MRLNKFAIQLALACILVAMLIAISSEAKKKKLKLKELKKMKKYAYLFGASNKKLYAIPFPVPLPIFVRRQQIYTQIPVLPRYVERPSYYTHSGPIAYASSPELYYSPIETAYQASNRPHSEETSGEEQEASMNQYKGQYRKRSVLSMAASTYLNQLGHQSVGNPMSLAEAPLIGRFLNGQAKLLSPSSLISSLKPISTANFHQEDQHELSEMGATKSKDLPRRRPIPAQELYLSSLKASHNEFGQMQPRPLSLMPIQPAGSMALHLMPHYLGGGAQLAHPLLPYDAGAALMEAASSFSPELNQNPAESTLSSQRNRQRHQHLRNKQMMHLRKVRQLRAMQSAHDEQADSLMEEARMAQSNSLALSAAQQIGMPILPEQLQIVKY